MISAKSVKIKRVITTTIYYGLLIALIGLFAYTLGYRFITLNILQASLQSMVAPVTDNAWWFVTAYIILAAMMPSINHYFNKVTWKKYLIDIFLIWAFAYSVDSLLNGAYYPLWRAVLFYTIGGWIGKFSDRRVLKPFSLVIILIIGYLLSTVSFYVIAHDGNATITCRILNSMINSIAVPICAISIFELFYRLNLQNNYINNIALTVFGIYLLHDSAISRELLWNVIIPIKNLYLSKLFPLYAVVITIVIFIVCSLLDGIRLKFIDAHMSKVYETFMSKIH